MMLTARGLFFIVLASTTLIMSGQDDQGQKAGASSNADHALQEVNNFGDDPGNLRMYMHVPSGNTPKTKRPMVVVIHGCTQSAKRIAELSGWNEMADHADFYVLYVEQRFWNDRAQCFSWFKEDDISPGKGEVASVNSMVQYASTHWPVDTARVFVYGVSSGGGLSAAAMACYPDVFKCGAVIAAPAYRGAKANKNRGKVLESPLKVGAIALGERITMLNPNSVHYPSLIIMHGTSDNVVNINEAEATAKQWSIVHNADTVPTKISQNFLGVKGVEQRVYSVGGKDVVTFYVFEGLGHKLPVQPGAAPKGGGKTTLVSPDVGIHSTYLIAQGFGLVK